MIHVLLIGGPPGCGKSTLVRALISELGEEPHYLKFSSFAFTHYPVNRLLIAGFYLENQTFGGTDRLPLNAQPCALRAARYFHHHEAFDGHTLIAEGDRLFNERFMDSLKTSRIPYKIILLSASEQTLAARANARQDQGEAQSESWRKGRHTKYENLQKLLNLNPEPHETPQDTARLIALINAWLLHPDPA